MPGTRKLNRPTDQRKAMLRNLVQASWKMAELKLL